METGLLQRLADAFVVKETGGLKTRERKTLDHSLCMERQMYNIVNA